MNVFPLQNINLDKIIYIKRNMHALTSLVILLPSCIIKQQNVKYNTVHRKFIKPILMSASLVEVEAR